MYGRNNKVDDNIKRWVLLHNPTEETIDFLESLKFNVIIGDTHQMLEYIAALRPSYLVENICVESNIEEVKSQQLKNYTIPPYDANLPSYSINSYFLEYTPQWSHIYSEKIPKTIHYKQLADSISSGVNICVAGTHCSGKTTLMMQLLYSLESSKPKFFMASPSLEQAKSFINIVSGSTCILFVDDCFRDTYAVIELLRTRNVQAILFDRDFSYERQYYLIKGENFKYIDITEISKADAQAILNILPVELKKDTATTKNFAKDPTILGVLASGLKIANFNFIKRFYNKDREAARVFLMVCYVHSCGIPCSFDMVYSFLGDQNYNWEDMFDIVERVGGLLTELTGDTYDFIDSIQNYYQCRSRYFAEKIISSFQVGNKEFAEVLQTFTEQVPQYKICQYDKFRRNAYDSATVNKAFNTAEEGLEFYELCSEKDDSEYIFQQAALFFSKVEDYKLAFNWIDKARSLAHYNRFSIDSTYAQIYFDVNCGASENQSEEALNILKKCCTSDKRKTIHFAAFSERAIKLYETYSSKNAGLFLKEALDFLNEGLSESNHALSQKSKWKLKSYKEKIQYLLKNQT